MMEAAYIRSSSPGLLWKQHKLGLVLLVSYRKQNACFDIHWFILEAACIGSIYTGLLWKPHALA